MMQLLALFKKVAEREREKESVAHKQRISQ